MKSAISRLSFVALIPILLELTLLPGVASGSSNYVLHDLGQRSVFGEPVAINDSGVVLGHSIDGTGQTLLWDSTHGTRSITALLAPSFVARDINNAGAVAGVILENVQPLGSYGQAALWDPLNGNLSLPSLGPESAARAINDAGQAVGGANIQNTATTHAVEWDSPTSVRDLGALNGSSNAYAINNSGFVAGVSMGSDGYEHAVVWNPAGQLTDLGMVPFGSHLPEVIGIDAANQVLINVGGIGGTEFQAFIRDGSGWKEVVTDSLFAQAYDMNEAGTIVGLTKLPGSNVAGQAFVWAPATGAQILPSLGSGINVAFAINNEGVIAGLCTAPDGLHDVLWPPVPEPSGLVALAGGMLGLLGLAQRRRVMRSKLPI